MHKILADFVMHSDFIYHVQIVDKCEWNASQMMRFRCSGAFERKMMKRGGVGKQKGTNVYDVQRNNICCWYGSKAFLAYIFI